MPFTYLAHQVPALALKRRWPATFDGVALALGTMAPDWAYALSGSRLAKVLQYTSHVLGSIVAVALLWRLLRAGDAGPPAARGTGVFLGVTGVGILAGGGWALGEPGLPAVLMRLSLGLALGLVVASVVCRRRFSSISE